MGLEKGFTQVKMEVLVCNNCGAVDKLDGDTTLRGKCHHCGNMLDQKKAKK